LRLWRGRSCCLAAHEFNVSDFVRYQEWSLGPS
jgi:hypothetical protein